MRSNRQGREVIREYSGFSGDYSLGVEIFNDSFALNRNYGRLDDKLNTPKIKISWHFSRNGRIENIERYSFQKQLSETFFKVVGANFNGFNTQRPDPKRLIESFDYDWINNFALFGHLPKDVSCIKEDFDIMELGKKYRYVISQGHLTCLDLMKNIKYGKVSSNEDLKGNIFSLPRIESDRDATLMIEKAAHLSPALLIISDIPRDFGEGERVGLINIIYEKMA